MVDDTNHALHILSWREKRDQTITQGYSRFRWRFLFATAPDPSLTLDGKITWWQYVVFSWMLLLLQVSLSLVILISLASNPLLLWRRPILMLCLLFVIGLSFGVRHMRIEAERLKFKPPVPRVFDHL